MSGPGSYLIDEKEKKEVMEVLETGYFFRYGDENDPAFKKKVYTFEKEFKQFLGAR